MALINCPSCNGTVSTKASACPHCGAAPVVELTEAERFQKLVDELGSISAARSAVESGIEPSSSPPAKSSVNETPKSNTMTAAAWVAFICIAVRLWIYADRAWTDHSRAVKAREEQEKAEQTFREYQESLVKLQELQRAEDLRKKLNPDIRDLMKVPSHYVEQPNPPSK